MGIHLIFCYSLWKIVIHFSKSTALTHLVNQSYDVHCASSNSAEQPVANEASSTIN